MRHPVDRILVGAGLHEALVSEAEFEAAQRANAPGKRRSRDVLSGRVRCGLCSRVLGVEYNERGQAIYRCKHRGRGPRPAGTVSEGPPWAALLGLDVLGEDQELQDAIRAELKHHDVSAEVDSRPQAVARVKAKRAKLLELYYDDRISADLFAEEEQRLATQLAEMERAESEREQRNAERTELAQRFYEVAELLAAVEFSELWEEATERERRTLVEELLDAAYVYPDHLRVVACGAPPLRVELTEVGLRPPAGMGTFVSEGGAQP